MVIAAAIFWLSSMPADSLFSPGPPEGLANVVFKKAAHLGMYGALAITLARALESRRGSWFWAFMIALVYGITDEWHQSFVPGREATFRDLCFDAAGAGLGLWLHQRLAPIETKRGETPLAATKSEQVES